MVELTKTDEKQKEILDSLIQTLYWLERMPLKLASSTPTDNVSLNEALDG